MKVNDLVKFLENKNTVIYFYKCWFDFRRACQYVLSSDLTTSSCAGCQLHTFPGNPCNIQLLCFKPVTEQPDIRQDSCHSQSQSQ